MKRVILALVCALYAHFSFSQSVPFPTGPRDNNQLEPWGYDQVGTNWDTSPFLPFIYQNRWFRLMPPNGVTYNSPTKTWTLAEPGKKYPLILFFHGAGEQGTDNNNTLKHGGQRHRNAVQSGEFPGFLVYPQSATIQQAKSIIEKLITDLPVDINRIYVHGLSNGGSDTWRFAITYQSLVAAAFPMSASDDDAKTTSMLYMPLRQAQGELDKNPAPHWTQTIVDWFNNNGGHLEYFYLPGVGHGTWNNMYNRSDFFSWFLSQKKNKILVRYDRNEICPSDPINVTMGFSPGFDAYEWRKDGVLISGATQNTVTVTQYGVYTGRIRNRGVWTDWSDPVEVKVKATTQTPPIQISALHSNVLPTPAGSTTTSLELPEGYQSYTWRNAQTNAVVSTSRVFTSATVGTYKAVVQEFNGCTSIESPVYAVVSANGPNKPSAVSGFIGYALSKTEIALTWIDNPSPQYNETGFEIYRAPSNSGPFNLIAIAPADATNYTDTDLSPNTTYHYIIRPVGPVSAGPVSETIAVKTEVDATPPTAPRNLKIVSYLENLVTLSWEGSTDDVGVYKYDIYKNGTRTLSINPSSTSATVYNLTGSEIYNFTVRARDVTGNDSPESNQVTRPGTNSGLSYKYYEGTWTNLPTNFNSLTPVKTGNSANVDITLGNRVNNIAFYWEGYIHIPVAGNYTFETRSGDGSKLYIGGYDEINRIVNNDGSHNLQYREGVKNFPQSGFYPIVITYFHGTRTSYGMEVYWKNTAHGVSARQRIPDHAFRKDEVMPGAVPVAPTQLTATAVSYKQINLSWIDNSNNETSFKVYRSTDNFGPFQVIGASAANTPSFTDTLVSAGTKYFYRVEAIGQYGESGFSSEILRGLTYSYYEATLSNFNTINSLVPKKTGVSPLFDLTVRDRDANTAIKWVGKIKIQTAGNYTFFTRSDDGSQLFINGVRIVQNDFNQGMTERSGVVTGLQAGVHDIIVLWRNATGGMGMEVRYQGPGIAKQFIPSSILADEEINATTLNLPAAPLAPANFVATPASSSSIQLSWNDSGANESRYEIYRSAVNSSNYVLYRTLAANTVQFTDVNLFANATFFYKVIAVGEGGSASSVEVSATTLNTNPVLSAIMTTTVKYDDTKNISVIAEDADNDAVILSVSGAPAFISFVDQGDGSGTIGINPTIANLGQYTLKVIATDTWNGSDTVEFKVVITDTNPPTIVPVSNTSINEGQPSSVIVSANSDLGNQGLSWEIEGLPSFGTFTSNNGIGTFVFSPDFIHSGAYPINVNVTDSQGNESSQSFTVNVTDVDPNTSIYVNVINSINGPSPWNNISSRLVNSLKDNQGLTTSVGLSFNTTWWSTYYEGAVTGNNSGVFPDNVIRDYYYFGIFGGPNTVSVSVNGLDPQSSYKFSFLGSSKWTGATDNGSTIYTIGSTSVSLNVQNNSQNVATISNVSPNASGLVNFTMSKAAGAPAGYLNGFVIEKQYQYGTSPAAPRDLNASVASSGIQLTWIDAPFNEDGFDVYRGVNENGPYTKVNTTLVAKNATQYIDTNVQEGVVYYYRVNAVNAFGTSAYSNVVSSEVPNVAPVITISGNLTITADEQSNLSVSAVDLPNNLFTISVVNLPSFATYQSVNSTSGSISFNPASGDVGAYTFTVLATDNEGATAEESVTIHVVENVLYRILVNFSNTASAPSPWNNTAKVPVGNDVFSNLRDEQNVNRGVTLTLQTAFGGSHNEGATTGNNSGVMPDAVLRDYYWFGIFNAPSQITMRVSGLSTANSYNLKFMSSSVFTNNGTVSDNGSTVFTIGSKSASVHAQANTTNLAIIKDVVTNSNGEIFVTISKAPGAPAGYLNGLVLEAVPIDPAIFVPSELNAAGISDSQVALSWSDNSPTETGFQIYRSTTDNENGFQLLATVGADVRSYTDNTVSEGQLYYYKVRAILPGGPTSYTNVASSGTIAFVIYINVSGAATYDAPAPWNNLSRFGLTNDVFSGFKNTDGEETGLQMRVKTSLQGANNWGMISNAGIFPSPVLQSFYFNDAFFEPGEFVIEGLDQGFNYNFGFMGSIDVPNAVYTDYIIGDKSATNRNDQNISTVSYIRDVAPDGNSEVTIVVKETAGSPWSIWNALVIQAYPTDRKGSATARSGRELSPATHEVRFGESNPRMVLYPNPAESNVNIKTFDSSIGDTEYSIFDMMGKVVETGRFNNRNIEADFSIDLQKHELKSAVYYIKVVYPDGKMRVNKFVKK